MKNLGDMAIMICGQRFTSRTETLENYFVKFSKKLAVVAMAGVRQKQNSNCKLYEDGRVTKEFDMSGFHLKGESFLFTLAVGIYYLIFLKNFFAANKKLDVKFDLFIGVQTWSTILGVLLKKMGKADKVIYYCIDYYRPTSRFGSKIETFVFKHLDRYCCKNSDVIWNLLARFGEDRRANFPNDNYEDKEITVPLTYSESLLKNRNISEIDRHSLGFAGTLEGEQGWEVLIKSVPIVKRKFADYKVHIYGNGSYKPKIEEIIDQVGVRQDVIMHGFIKEESELLDRLSRCAAGIAPYLPHKVTYGGFDAGKPKLYALVGLPIIMTYAESIESQLSKYKAGRTFQYDPESLAKVIIEVMESDDLLQEYKRNANDFAKRFTSEEIFPAALEKTFAIIKKEY